MISDTQDQKVGKFLKFVHGEAKKRGVICTVLALSGDNLITHGDDRINSVVQRGMDLIKREGMLKKTSSIILPK